MGFSLIYTYVQSVGAGRNSMSGVREMHLSLFATVLHVHLCMSSMHVHGTLPARTLNT